MTTTRTATGTLTTEQSTAYRTASRELRKHGFQIQSWSHDSGGGLMATHPGDGEGRSVQTQLTTRGTHHSGHAINIEQFTRGKGLVALGYALEMPNHNAGAIALAAVAISIFAATGTVIEGWTA